MEQETNKNRLAEILGYYSGLGLGLGLMLGMGLGLFFDPLLMLDLKSALYLGPSLGLFFGMTADGYAYWLNNR